MSKCCGKEHTGNYCPNCGRMIGKTPLEQLKDHLRRNIERCQQTCDAQRDYGLSAKSVADANLAKWTSWLEAIVEVEKKAQKSPQSSK